MRIAVLCSPDGWHFQDLCRAAGQNHEVISFPFERLASEVNGATFFNLSADAVIVRSMPPGSLQQIVFRMDLLGQLAANGTLVLNSPRSIEAAVDKYLSLTMLQANGVPVPNTMVSQGVGEAIEQFESLGKDVVVKPLFGSMGNGLVRLRNVDQAVACFQQLSDQQQVIYQQQFVEHGGFDTRVLVIGDQVLGMKRTNPGNWITNISQGGVGVRYEPSSDETELAIRSARAVGAHFAGVDLLRRTSDGRQFVLEVNAVPGWQAISAVRNTDVAKMILGETESMWNNDRESK